MNPVHNSDDPGRARKRLSIPISAPILALSVLVYLAFAFAFYPFVIDDTYITFRYADNFAEGGAISFNPDDINPVEGYTSFLWMVISAVAIRIQTDPLLATRLIGVLSGVAAIFVLYLLARHTIRSRPLATVPPLMLAVSSEFAEWSISGMETVFFLMLFLLSLYRLIVESRGNHFPFSGFIFAFLALTRPEGVAFFFVALAYLVLLKSKVPAAISWSRRRIILFAALFCIVYGPYFLWRFMYYGYIFTNSYYAKQMANGGARYIGEFLLYLGPVLLFAILGHLPRLCGLHRSRDATWIPFLGALIIVNLAGVWNIRPAMAWDWRLLLHLLPLFFILSLATSARWLGSPVRRLRWIGLLVPILLVGWCSHPHLLPRRLAEARAIIDGLDHCHKPLARWLRSVMDPDATIAVVDTGIIPYLSRLRAIDIATIPLNNQGIAHKSYSATEFWSKKPRAFVIRGNEKGELQEHSKRIPLLQKAVDEGFVLVKNVRFRENYVLYVYADLRFLRRPPENAPD